MFATWNDADQRFAFSVGAVDKTSVEVTDEEYAALFDAQAQGKQIVRGQDGAPVAADPAPTWAEVQRAALRALTASDRVATRCIKAGVPYPSEWRQYDASLRAIVADAKGDPSTGLPTAPSYPAGT